MGFRKASRPPYFQTLSPPPERIEGRYVMKKERLWTKNFIILGVVNFCLFCSFFFYTPTLPLFMVGELAGSEDHVGLIAGIFTISAVLVRGWSGMIVDQLGKRQLLLLSLAIFAVVMVGYKVAFAVWVLLLVRFLQGGAFGLATTVTQTIAAYEVPQSRRGEGLGYFGTMTTVAMAIGPVIGLTIASRWSFQGMFTTSVVICLMGLFLSYFMKFKEQGSKKGHVDLRIDMQNLKAMYEPKAIPIASSMVFLAMVFGGITSFISLYAVYIGDEQLGGLYFTIYASALFFSRPISGKLYDRKGPDVVIYPGMLLYFIGMLMLGLTKGPFLFLCAGFIIGIGYGSIQPSLQAHSIDLVHPKKRGAATATFFNSIDLGIGLGGFCAGFIVKLWSYQTMFLISSVFVIASCMLYFRARVKEKKRLISKHSTDITQ